MENHRCPSCGASTVVEGRLLEAEGGPVGFVPHGTRRRLLSTGVGVPSESVACTSCGFLWTRLKPAELEAYLQKYDSDLAREHRASLWFGPAHDLPDHPDARRAGEGVAELDALVFKGVPTKATLRYRDLMGVTWDEADDVLRDWHRLSRAEKLARFGWRPKGAPGTGDPDAEPHPMHDPTLDGV